MATLAIQPVSKTGTALSFAAATSGGDKCHVGNDVYLIVKNGSGASVTVTIATSATDGGFAVDDNAVAVAAGAETIIGPITRELYAGSDDLAAITYSASASVTVCSVAA